MSGGQWAADPTGRHQLRFYDGTRWTEHVSNAGVQTTDPLPPPPTHATQPTMPTSPAPMPARAGGLLGGRKGLQEENAQLRATLEGLGVAERDALRAETARLRAEASALQSQVVVTNEHLLLQEIGVYDYAHPLDSSVAYKTWLDQTKQHIKRLAAADRAVTCTSQWTVNGSPKEGARMVRDISKLMLRAYNAEADSCVRSVKPTTRESVVARLDKTRETIAKLGQSMQIRISDELHATRVQEIRVTADFLAKRGEEKEQERAERARLREEERVAREIANEQAKLVKERQQYETALAQLIAKGDAALRVNVS